MNPPILSEQSQRRLILVSNRLPFTARVVDGVLSISESAGGVATGLSSVLDSYRSHLPNREADLWVGWPGSTIEEPWKSRLQDLAIRDHHAFPVFLSEEEMDDFYLGFCNKTLWPLFHYFPSFTAYREEYWDRYTQVNRRFADTLSDILRPGDRVWVQDYHLMLLPALLRERHPELLIGFFLHIPFPSFEIFRLLPPRWRSALLEGTLGADLVGFHTYEYTHHFLQSVLRILGHDHAMGRIVLPSHVVRAETYPMGIDYHRFSTAAHDPDTESEKQTLRGTLKDLQVILSVDRLDYSKGILHRLDGYEALLERRPEFHGKVVLIVIVVPSRIGVDEYEQMKRQIEERVGRINGRFGTVRWSPIIYQYRHLSLHSLAAFYGISDVALVTPLRDGMNLIAKEYIASRPDQTGVLILSEMAGAAKELSEAIIINPNDRIEIATALAEALEMPPEEQQRRNALMQQRLQRYDVVRWAADFLNDLESMSAVQEQFNVKLLTKEPRRNLVSSYAAASHRLLLFDYDGTLEPFARRPSLAEPSVRLRTVLSLLSTDQRNMVVILSGRDRDSLDRWFGKFPLALAAEHGCWLKDRGKAWAPSSRGHTEWKPQVLTILQQYADRLPGAFVEEKEYSLVWHYRTADPDQARPLAAELMDRLISFTANLNVQTFLGSKVIEVRIAGVNKGAAVTHWLSGEPFDFILAIGDDSTDEDLFAALPEKAITIRVGVTTTRARYTVQDVGNVLALLEKLVSTASSTVPSQTP